MQAASTPTNAVRFWDRIIAVHPSITDVERSRQSRLLNIFFLAATGLLTSIVLTELIQVIQKLSTVDSLWPYLAAMAAFVLTYIANKRGYYRAASYGFVLSAFIIFPVDYLFNGYSAGSLLSLIHI